MSSLAFLFFLFAVTAIECTGFDPLGYFRGQYCIGTNTRNYGTCQMLDDCTATGSVADGNCALSNTGVCCLATLRCDATATTNSSYFASADYPNGTDKASTCSMKTSLFWNAAYVRLEFNVFEVTSTSKDGVCTDDYLLVEGAKQTVPKICGKNTGQHLYLRVEPYGTLSLKMVLSSASFSRKWLIKIIQLESTNPSLPPFGCLQYYSALDGKVNSFNFDVDNKVGGGNIDKFNYRVCFASHHGFCKVQLTTDYFEMSGNELHRRKREEEKVNIPIELFNELMKQNEEFNRLHGNTTAATSDLSSTDAAPNSPSTDSTPNLPSTDVTTDAPFMESTVGLIVNGCQNRDSLYFSPINRQDILPVFCGDSLRFSVGLNDEPFFIRVRNTGAVHGKGFSLKYKYAIC